MHAVNITNVDGTPIVREPGTRSFESRGGGGFRDRGERSGGFRDRDGGDRDGGDRPRRSYSRKPRDRDGGEGGE